LRSKTSCFLLAIFENWPVIESNKQQTNMLKLFPLLATFALALPASATPNVVKYDELMVKVPGLEELGWSRISTVEHCAAFTGVKDWAELITDSDLEGMEKCLIQHT
jgi:hypothetical protein